MKKRIRILIGVVVFGLVLGPIWFLAQPNRNVLKFAGPTPAGYHLLTRSQLEGNALLDLRLPLIGHVRYPKNPEFPRGYSSQNWASGIVFPAPRIVPFGERWEIGGLELGWRFQRPGGYSVPQDSYLLCPYVFGKEPRAATLHTERSLALFLPGNGITPPEATVSVQKVGKWTVKVETGFWISPSLAFPLRLKVDGAAPGETLFAEFVQDQIPIASVQLGKDNSGYLMLSTWTNGPFSIRLKSGLRKSVRLRYRTTKSGAAESTELVLESGQVVSYSEFQGGSGTAGELDTPLITADAAEGRIVGSYLGPTGSFPILGIHPRIEGKTFAAEGFWEISRVSFTPNVKLPDLKRYPLPHAESLF